LPALKLALLVKIVEGVSFGDLLSRKDAPLKVYWSVYRPEASSNQVSSGATLDRAGHGYTSMKEDVLCEGEELVSLEILAIKSYIKSSHFEVSSL